MRLFLSVKLPPALHCAAEALQARLMPAIDDVKWAAPGQLHITLYFLGETQAGRLPALQAVLRGLEALPPLKLALCGAGAFPSSGRPQVLWCGVRDISGGLSVLYRRLGGLLREAGFSLEDSAPFQPHITLGRVKKSSQGQGAVLALGLEASAESEPEAASVVELVESRLSSAGPVYGVLARAELRGKP